MKNPTSRIYKNILRFLEPPKIVEFKVKGLDFTDNLTPLHTTIRIFPESKIIVNYQLNKTCLLRIKNFGWRISKMGDVPIKPILGTNTIDLTIWNINGKYKKQILLNVKFLREPPLAKNIHSRILAINTKPRYTKHLSKKKVDYKIIKNISIRFSNKHFINENNFKKILENYQPKKS